MKRRILMTTVTVASLLFSGLALAQDRDGRNGQGQDRGKKDRDGPHDNRYGNKHRPSPQARDGERGAGPEHDFYRGGRLPIQYRDRGYVVDDWRGHRLSAPPRGYHWVQTGGDYVLVANATGIIFQIYLGG